MQIYWTTLKDVKKENSQVKTYIFNCPEDYTWDEGAHIHLAFEGFNAGEKPDRSLVRHMSISTYNENGDIGITTRLKEQPSKFKNILDQLPIGGKAAIFKTHTNVPLKREGKNIIMLSAGVGLATLRPLALKYIDDSSGVNKIHSLNVDSSKEYLFTDIFNNDNNNNITAEFTNNRADYYEKAEGLMQDKDALYYVVGSDEFLKENIDLLLKNDIPNDQISLDKHPSQRETFI